MPVRHTGSSCHQQEFHCAIPEELGKSVPERCVDSSCFQQKLSAIPKEINDGVHEEEIDHVPEIIRRERQDARRVFFLSPTDWRNTRAASVRHLTNYEKVWGPCTYEDFCDDLYEDSCDD